MGPWVWKGFEAAQQDLATGDGLRAGEEERSEN